MPKAISTGSNAPTAPAPGATVQPLIPFTFGVQVNTAPGQTSSSSSNGRVFAPIISSLVPKINPPVLLVPDSLFKDPTGDIILRSSDGIQFRVHKILLSLASPFFKDMFSLPQRDERDIGAQIVPMEENSHTVDALLSLCYPKWTADLCPKNLDDIQAVLEAATKYDMDEVRQYIGKQLLAAQNYTEYEYLRIYAIARRFRLENVARIAAKETLRLPSVGRPYYTEFEHITAASLHSVLDYHYKCSKAAHIVISGHKGLDAQLTVSVNQKYVWFDCSLHFGSDSQLSHASGVITVVSWWMEYMMAVEKALEDRPCASSVRDTKLVEDTIQKACTCTMCRSRAPAEFPEFVQKLASDVETAISKIALDIRF